MFRFTAYTMLYFVAATYSEHLVRTEGLVPEAVFLLAHETDFRLLVERFYRRLCVLSHEGASADATRASRTISPPRSGATTSPGCATRQSATCTSIARLRPCGTMAVLRRESNAVLGLRRLLGQEPRWQKGEQHGHHRGGPGARPVTTGAGGHEQRTQAHLEVSMTVIGRVSRATQRATNFCARMPRSAV